MREWPHGKERELKGDTRGRDGYMVGLNQKCPVPLLGWGKPMQARKEVRQVKGRRVDGI